MHAGPGRHPLPAATHIRYRIVVFVADVATISSIQVAPGLPCPRCRTRPQPAAVCSAGADLRHHRMRRRASRAPPRPARRPSLCVARSLTSNTCERPPACRRCVGISTTGKRRNVDRGGHNRSAMVSSVQPPRSSTVARHQLPRPSGRRAASGASATPWRHREMHAAAPEPHQRHQLLRCCAS